MKRSRTTQSSTESTQKRTRLNDSPTGTAPSNDSPPETAPLNVGKIRVQNTMIHPNIKNFYLNASKADVFFVFDADTEHAERVPAHKFILTTISPVFKSMLSAWTEENVDIYITDATADGFKKFLQFLYLPLFELTSKDIVEVLHLCIKYDFAKALMVCRDWLKMSLTTENVCAWYGIAKLMKWPALIGSCEMEIECNPEEVCSSASFLKCDREVFGNVLRLLMEGKCEEVDKRASQVIDACMAWAKAECERNGLEATPINLKTQLKDFMKLIPFRQMCSSSFRRFITTYNGFLDTNDMATIIMELMDSDHYDRYGQRLW